MVKNLEKKLHAMKLALDTMEMSLSEYKAEYKDIEKLIRALHTYSIISKYQYLQLIEVLTRYDINKME